MARPQRVLPRWRAGVPHILHQRPRRRGDGDHLELPRHHTARPSGNLGGLAGGLPPDRAVQVVELARQLRRRSLAAPEVGGYTHRRSRSRLAKARRGGEGELKKGRPLRAFEPRLFSRRSRASASPCAPSIAKRRSWWTLIS